MAQWEFVEWLMFWILETSHYEFEWDKGNQSKNKEKHGITTEEMEAVFRSGAAHPKKRKQYEEILRKISKGV